MLASLGWSLVFNEVFATYCKSELSISIFLSLKESRISKDLFLANSYPSVIIRGWTPSYIKSSAYFNNSPIKSTFEVVPSPTVSS